MAGTTGQVPGVGTGEAQRTWGTSLGHIPGTIQLVESTSVGRTVTDSPPAQGPFSERFAGML